MADNNGHSWPADDSCVFGPWQSNTGMPKPTQYRVCVHPQCYTVEHRDAPQG